jgi:hypothetical protein
MQIYCNMEKRGEDRSRNMSAGGGEEGVARKLKRCGEFT